MTKWSMVYRSLSHFEFFALLVGVHFFVLDVSRCKMGDGVCTLFPFKMNHSGKNGSLYTVYTIRNHALTTVQTKRTLLRGVSVPVCIAKSLFFYFPFYLSCVQEREIYFLKGSFLPLEALFSGREFFAPWGWGEDWVFNMLVFSWELARAGRPELW